MKLSEALQRQTQLRARSYIYHKWRMYVMLKVITTLNCTGLMSRLPVTSTTNGGGPLAMTLMYKFGSGKKQVAVKRKVMSTTRIFSSNMATPPESPASSTSPSYSGLATVATCGNTTDAPLVSCISPTVGAQIVSTASSYIISSAATLSSPNIGQEPNGEHVAALQREIAQMKCAMDAQKRAIDMRDRLINDVTRQRDDLIALTDSLRDTSIFGGCSNNTRSGNGNGRAAISSSSNHASRSCQTTPLFCAVSSRTSEDADENDDDVFARVKPMSSMQKAAAGATSPTVVPSPPIAASRQDAQLPTARRHRNSVDGAACTSSTSANKMLLASSSPSLLTSATTTTVPVSVQGGALLSHSCLTVLSAPQVCSASDQTNTDTKNLKGSSSGPAASHAVVRASNPGPQLRHAPVLDTASAVVSLSISSLARQQPGAVAGSGGGATSESVSQAAAVHTARGSAACSSSASTSSLSQSLPATSRKVAVSAVRGLAILPHIIAGGATSGNGSGGGGGAKSTAANASVR